MFYVYRQVFRQTRLLLSVLVSLARTEVAIYIHDPVLKSLPHFMGYSFARARAVIRRLRKRFKTDRGLEMTRMDDLSHGNRFNTTLSLCLFLYATHIGDLLRANGKE